MTPADGSAAQPPVPRTCAEVDWPAWQPNMLATLLFIREGERVLLMRKKRGLGAGKINAPGGKVDPGESPRQCAVREAQEELGVTARDPAHRGRLHFQFVDGLAIRCDVFVAHAHEGVAVETDEGAPLWTEVDAIPYGQMWADDRVWLPGVLAGRAFLGYFIFDGDAMLDHTVDWDPDLPGVDEAAP